MAEKQIQQYIILLCYENIMSDMSAKLYRLRLPEHTEQH